MKSFYLLITWLSFLLCITACAKKKYYSLIEDPKSIALVSSIDPKDLNSLNIIKVYYSNLGNFPSYGSKTYNEKSNNAFNSYTSSVLKELEESIAFYKSELRARESELRAREKIAAKFTVISQEMKEIETKLIAVYEAKLKERTRIILAAKRRIAKISAIENQSRIEISGLDETLKRAKRNLDDEESAVRNITEELEKDTDYDFNRMQGVISSLVYAEAGLKDAQEKTFIKRYKNDIINEKEYHTLLLDQKETRIKDSFARLPDYEEDITKLEDLVNKKTGTGVLKDDEEAVKWYRKAAYEGDSAAQNSLGVMYAEGKGVLKDLVQAHVWYNIAGANGHESAKKNLANIEKEMTFEQKAEAMKLAHELFAKLPKG